MTGSRRIARMLFSCFVLFASAYPSFGLQREASLDYDSALAVAVDAAGNVYFTEGDRVRKVAREGRVSTIAGTGTYGFSGDGGPATSADLDEPTGIAIDAAGNLLIADRRNNRIRRVGSDSVISTIAGTGVQASDGDGGPATAAALFRPVSVAVDGAGNLFINEGNRIRKVSRDGVISTFAGVGIYGLSGDGGPATLARISANSGGMTVDRDGNLLFAEPENRRVRMVTSTGTISTLAEFEKSFPWGVALDAGGNLLVTFPNEERVQRITPDGRASTVAGTGSSGLSGDGGPAVFARLSSPRGIAVSASGDFLIADFGNNRIRKVAPEGLISTVGYAMPKGANAVGTLIALSSDNQMYGLEGALFFFEIHSGGRQVELQRLGSYWCSDGSSRSSFGLRCYPSPGQGNPTVSFSLATGDYELRSYALGCNGNCGSPGDRQAECVARFSIKSAETLIAQRQGSTSGARGCRLTFLESIPK